MTNMEILYITGHKYMNKIWTLICGSLRTEIDFLAIMSVCCKLRYDGKIYGIIWSTWTSEPDKIPGIRAKLEKLGIVIIETDPPKTLGNIYPTYYYQAVQIHNGLRIVPNDAFVIKCRSDYCLNRFYLVLSTALSGIDTYQNDNFGHFTSGFLGKIYIHSFQWNIPFAASDIVLAGHKVDLVKMIVIEDLPAYLNHNMRADNQIFAGCFIHEYPFFSNFFDLFSNWEIWNDSQRIFRLIFLEKLSKLNNDDFELPAILNKYFALYFAIFYCAFQTRENEISSVKENIEFRDLFLVKMSDGRFGFQEQHTKRLQLIFEGKIKNSTGWQRFFVELKKLRDIPNYGKTMLITNDDLTGWHDFLKQLGLSNSPYFTKNSDLTRQGHFPLLENSDCINKILFKDYTHTDSEFSEFNNYLVRASNSKWYRNLYTLYKQLNANDNLRQKLELTILRGKGETYIYAHDIRLKQFRALLRQEQNRFDGECVSGIIVSWGLGHFKEIENAEQLAAFWYGIKCIEQSPKPDMDWNPNVYVKRLAFLLDLEFQESKEIDSEHFALLAEQKLQENDYQNHEILEQFLEIIKPDRGNYD
jgi:hypothetical protein